MENKPLSKAMSIILIIVLTLADVLTVGLHIITYAASELSSYTATNKKNVTFDVYFKGDNGEILQSKQESINSTGLRLFMQIGVNNEGHFNGELHLNNSNFKFKKEILSNGINKIEENTITLNQINAGEVIEIEVGIEAIKEDHISPNLLTMPSTISINGKYKDSTENEEEIQAQRDVTLIFNNPFAENEGVELTSEILTNSVCQIEGENKRIVQVLLKSGLKENGYPIKETNIKVSTLSEMQGINVIARGSIATNGRDETVFDQNNWIYLQQEDQIQIKVTNPEQEGNINWIKDGRDEFVVTYLLDENAQIDHEEITATATITLYDRNQTEKMASATAIITEEKDGIVTTSTSVKESNIYKGKIYGRTERSYDVTNNIYVSNQKVNRQIDVNLKEATYQVGEEFWEANIQYVTTTIEKSQLDRILGENGVLQIQNADGGVIAQINKETETDENGKITVNYPEGVKQIAVKTTEVVSTGTIRLENRKVIKAENYNKEMMRRLQAIHENTNDSNAVIALNDTTTVADIAVNNNRLSTLSKNENIEINVTLRTDDERYDLYKNPTLEIALPNNIKNVDIKSINLIHGNGFEEDYTQMMERNGQKIIQIGLRGEQTNYTADINQTTIVITADIEFGLLTPSQTQKMDLNYTNQNGKDPQYNQEIDINIESKYGLMIYSQLNDFNKAGDYKYTIDNEVPTGSLDMNSEAKMATMGLAILNNYDTDMTDVNIVGRIPSKGIYDGTIDTQMINGLETSLEGVTIMYSTSSTASVNDGSWSENAENAKSFKIVLDHVAKGQVIQAKYSFMIPEGLSYGQSLYGRTEVEYTYLDQRMNQTSNIGAETERLTVSSYADSLGSAVTTKMSSGVDVSISTITAGSELHDGDSVYEGQTIKYVMKVTNHTGVDLSNINIQAVQENAHIYDLQGKDAYNDGLGLDHLTSYFWEELDTNTKDFYIESLKNEESTELTYQAVVNEVDGEEAKTFGNITIESQNLEKQTVTTITNTIKQAKLKMMISQANAEELNLYSLGLTQYIIRVQNLSEKTLEDVSIEVNISERIVFFENI